MKKEGKFWIDSGENTGNGRPSIDDLLLINTSFFNLLMPILLFLFIRLIPQANHLVFGQLQGQDPIYSTLMIGIYTVFSILIYFRHKSLIPDSQCIANAFKWVNRIAFILPTGVWLVSILVNSPKQHPVSIFLSFVILGLLFLAHSKSNPFHALLLDKNINKVIWIILSVIVLIFLFLLFVFSEVDTVDKLPMQFTVILIIIFLLVGASDIYYINRNKSTRLETKQLFSEYRNKNVIYFVLIFAIVVVLFGNYHHEFGTGFDILIYYFLCIRALLFIIGTMFRYSVNVNLSRTKKIVFRALLFLAVVLTPFIWPDTSREHYKLTTINKSKKRDTLQNYVKNWLSLKPVTDSTPIFLISGQGGGSRAGCTFFTSMALLDSLIDGNTLLITTVSGSSNGAGFYLSAKNNFSSTSLSSSLMAYNDTIKLRMMDSILYHKDYVSASLFNLLFTDFIRSVFWAKKNDKSRNVFLMNQEKESFEALGKELKFGPNYLLDSSWSSIYEQGNTSLPLFLPMTYNIELGIKAISSPVFLPDSTMHAFYPILDSLPPDEDLQINRSILISQMFPLISASASIDSFHYMDGGVYDNLAFETLFDIYTCVARMRDSMAVNRPIALISIANSDYEDDIEFKDIRSDIKATSKAVSQSLFSTNPIVQKSEGLQKLNVRKDGFFELKIYHPEPDSVVESFSEKFCNLFMYKQTGKVILSRYLTMVDINKKIIEKSYQEVDSFKLELNKFLMEVNKRRRNIN